MTTFQRARSEEHRAIRRQAILDTAAQMLSEMPVSDISLNELSRRTSLAKSAILRYFESREAVLLELLDQAWKQWTAAAAEHLAAEIDSRQPAGSRGDAVAAILARTLTDHPQLCDLLSAQAGVLERNVSAEVAARYKHAAMDNVAALAALLRAHLPEIGDLADRLAPMIVMATGIVWTNSRPSPGMLAAYAADAQLACMRMEFGPTLGAFAATLIAGTLTQSAP